MTARRKRGGGVPPLRNEDVTGMTEPRQDAAIRESGTDPDRGDAAREFLDEQNDQARATPSSAARRGTTRPPAAGVERRPDSAASVEDTELRKHWDPASKRKR